MSKRIGQVHSSSTSLDQILCGVENQMLMLLISTVKYFSYPERATQVSKSNPIPFKSKENPNHYLDANSEIGYWLKH